ncbi:polysaccharide deacetylase [Hyaloraphidium curvatum]|nr:polysaccharide deacetylase [Hyaloraphidium curvatum]
MLVYQCRSPGMVALTFDDGSFKDTEALLNILDGRNVKATFFVNGQNFDDVRNRAGLIRRMKNTGHCAGLHGYFHYDMRTLDRDKQYANLKQLDDLLLQIMGARTRFFRPPYGGIGADTAAVCASLGLDIIMWNVDSRDWEYHDNKRSVAVYEAQCTDPRTQSFVGLQHDVFPETALGLASWVIDTLRYRGFRFVTVGECVYGSTSACYQ